MAARVVRPPTAVASLSIRDDDPTTTTATDAAGKQVQQAIQALQRSANRQVIAADLTVGRNVIRHGLVRAVRGYSFAPTVADATFAHAIDNANPHPDREVWINVIGVAQPGVQIEVW